MSEQQSAQTPVSSRRLFVVGGLVLVVLAVVIILVLTGRGAADDAEPGSTPSAAPSSSSTDGTTGDADASQEPTGDEGDEGDEAPAEKATTGPAKGASDDESTVDQDGRVTQAPSGFDESAEPAGDVTVEVVEVEKVEGLAELPGEIGGPSLRFTVEIHNGSDEALDLRTVVVNAYYGTDRTPAITLVKPGSAPFPASVGPGDDAQGTFVYNVPPDQRDLVRVEVDLGVGAEIVAFEGSVG
ncbi:hypothetical protein IF650_10040 [Cellulosimicrobium terreum]|nr:hypothetical protein [Cellulosimicrobium terreum]